MLYSCAPRLSAPAAPHAKPGAGFTLLEILAVMLIGALLMSFMVPNLSALGSRMLQGEAQNLVAAIDLGRQRSVMTGAPHRLVIDLESNGYGLELERSEPTEEEVGKPALNRLSFSSEDALFTRPDQLSLSPPQNESEPQFVPIPGLLGRFEILPSEVTFSGVETPGGWVDFGEAIVRFERDGSSSYSVIVLSDSSGNQARLEILPLADTVRIDYEEQ